MGFVGGDNCGFEEGGGGGARAAALAKSAKRVALFIRFDRRLDLDNLKLERVTLTRSRNNADADTPLRRS